MSAAVRRLKKEYETLINSSIKNVIRNVTYDEPNFLTWTGFIVLDEPPYNKGAFKIEITFPVEYPFKPPKVIFKTRIYHPNIDEKGQICLPIINPENWKPATKVEHGCFLSALCSTCNNYIWLMSRIYVMFWLKLEIIQALVAMLHAPEVEHALRSDLAEEYAKDQKKFFKNAEEFTRKYAEKIPNL
ncbi:unnamed protein product [Schistosoma margrebowiei]|uniref:UBIQUITIN_CONJUGAT_2 domain-containing protein n=1 Tax=Schistosoma margrebowiei TaxID=48269 RepID=A0AA85A3P1_9TREM|nr:unnamed protein product [Schistosoma margrebowiei]